MIVYTTGGRILHGDGRGEGGGVSKIGISV